MERKKKLDRILNAMRHHSYELLLEDPTSSLSPEVIAQDSLDKAIGELTPKVKSLTVAEVLRDKVMFMVDEDTAICIYEDYSEVDSDG